jgi:hypothetical protein
MSFADIAWAAVNFAVSARAEQIDALKPTFQQAFDDRKALPEKMRDGGDPSVIKTTLENSQEQIQAKLKEVLDGDQNAKLAQWQKDLAAKLNQRGDGERRGPGQEPALTYLDRTWSQLAFLVAATVDEMAQLTPVYTQAWTDRVAALATDDEDDRTTKVKAIKQTLEAKLKAVLTDDQVKQMQRPAFGPPPR